MIQRNSDLTDRELGNYKIVRRIGKGGMATVYKAHELSLNRMVALKVLEPHLSEDPAFIKRFEREAQAAAQLNHPNIVQIYAIGEDEGIHYIAMEYVKGEPLSEIIRNEGYLDPKRAVGLIRQATEALREAHRADLVHRDVKPHNILVDGTGRVKVTDFGIAFIPQADTRLTQAGAVIGTPEYISPEQCQSKPVDARSDLYSLGVTFYEMLSGKTPYQADTPVSMLMKIVEGKFLPLSEVNPDVPASLQRIVEKMMNPDAEIRYRNADEVIEALRAWTPAAPAQAAEVPPPPPPLPTTGTPSLPAAEPLEPPVSRDNTKNALVIAGVILLLVGIAFGGWKVLASRGAGTQGEQTVAPIPKEVARDVTQGPPPITVPSGQSAPEASEDADRMAEPDEPHEDVAQSDLPISEEMGTSAAVVATVPSPATATSRVGEETQIGTAAGSVEPVAGSQAAVRAEPPPPEPPWNSIVVSIRGDDYESTLIEAVVQARFEEARYQVIDDSAVGARNLGDIARYNAVVTVRQMGSTTLQYYGRQSEMYTVSLVMKIVGARDGRVLAGPRSTTVKYTTLNAEENLRTAVTDLAYSLQEELARRGPS